MSNHVLGRTDVLGGRAKRWWQSSCHDMSGEPLQSTCLPDGRTSSSESLSRPEHHPQHGYAAAPLSTAANLRPDLEEGSLLNFSAVLQTADTASLLTRLPIPGIAGSLGLAEATAQIGFENEKLLLSQSCLPSSSYTMGRCDALHHRIKVMRLPQMMPVQTSLFPSKSIKCGDSVEMAFQ